MTTTQRAQQLVEKFGFKQNARGAYECKYYSFNVYIGSRCSIRLGNTKATSRPTDLTRLESILEATRNCDPLPTTPTRKPLTAYRYSLHQWINTLDLDQCIALAENHSIEVRLEGKQECT